jgi:hypothetical protein
MTMKKTFFLLFTVLLLNGCAESIALIGSSAGGASSGKILQSSLNSAVSYGIKKQTGKTPLGHALTYAEEKNPEKKKETCASFVKKTNAEICAILKNQIALTKVKIKNKKETYESSKKHTSSLQPILDKKFKIKYLDQ